MSSDVPMKKKIQTCMAIVSSTAIALFGTAVLESSLVGRFHPHTSSGVIWREWIASVVLAALLGFLVQRSWKGSVATLSWVIPSVSFLAGVLMHFGAGHIVRRFSGYDCANEAGVPSCNAFLLFTVPLLRGVAFSIAAIIALRVPPLARES